MRLYSCTTNLVTITKELMVQHKCLFYHLKLDTNKTVTVTSSTTVDLIKVYTHLNVLLTSSGCPEPKQKQIISQKK